MRISTYRFPIPNFADVAKLIAPENAPLWLPAHLEWWAQGVRYGQIVDRLHPSTLEARERLAALAEAATLIEQELQSPVIKGLLVAANTKSTFNTSCWEMKQLASRARSARSSPQLCSADGSTKRGPGKPNVVNIFDARTLCAVRIVDMWRFFRKQVPGIGNLEAAAATQAYWLACGGTSAAYGDPLNGWHDYFKIVRDKSGSPGLKQMMWWRDLEQATRRKGPPWYLGTYNPVQEPEIKSPIPIG